MVTIPVPGKFSAVVSALIAAFMLGLLATPIAGAAVWLN